MSGTRAVLASLSLTLLSVSSTWADHAGGGARPREAGLGWLIPVVLLVGFLVVALLAGWAMFAPEREESVRKPDDAPEPRT